MDRISLNVISWAVLFSLVVMWGGSFGLTKIAVSSIDPEWVVSFRLIIASIIMIIFLIATKRKLPKSIKAWFWFFLIGSIGNAIPFFLTAWSVQYIPSSLIGIFMSTTPLFVLVLAAILLKDEFISKYNVLGVLLGFVGAVILFGYENISNFKFSGIEIWAQIGAIATALFYASYGVAGRYINKYSFGRFETAAGVLIAGSIVSSIISYVNIGYLPDKMSNSAIISVLILGMFPTAIATIFLFYLLEVKGTIFVSLVNYMVPIFSIFVGVLFLDEILKLNAIIGMIIIFVGLWISEFMNKKKRLSK